MLPLAPIVFGLDFGLDLFLLRHPRAKVFGLLLRMGVGVSVERLDFGLNLLVRPAGEVIATRAKPVGRLVGVRKLTHESVAHILLDSENALLVPESHILDGKNEHRDAGIVRSSRTALVVLGLEVGGEVHG